MKKTEAIKAIKEVLANNEMWTVTDIVPNEILDKLLELNLFKEEIQDYGWDVE